MLQLLFGGLLEMADPGIQKLGNHSKHTTDQSGQMFSFCNFFNCTEKRRRRRLCNSSNSAGGIADIAWCCHDSLSDGLAAT